MSLLDGVESTSTEETTTETTAETTSTETTSDGTVTANYYFAEDIPASGEKPEWFKDSKYKTISDQAKAYTDLEKRFGSFTGSPKDGKYEIEGVDFTDNPLMELVAGWGIENNLSTEGMGSLVSKVNELAQQQAKEDRENALKELGSNATERLSNLSLWGKNNLSEDEYKSFEGLAQTAGQVAVLEKLIDMTKNSKLVETEAKVFDINSAKEELKSLQFATDNKGRRLVDIDSDHRKKVIALAETIAKSGK